METEVQSESEASLIEDLKRRDSTAYQKAVRDYSPGMLAVARFYLEPLKRRGSSPGLLGDGD